MKIATTLTLEYRESGGASKFYYCKVIEKRENFVLIDYPIDSKTKKTTFFSNQTLFLASYVGEDQVVYEFPTKILKKVKLNVPAIKITLPAEESFKRIQRREFVRVDASIDIAVHSPNSTFHPFTTVSLDISGGGIAFINSNKLELENNEEIELWFVLTYQNGELHYVQTRAEIVFIGKRQNLNMIAVKFIKLKPSDQQKIVRFTFEKQREYQKRMNTV